MSRRLPLLYRVSVSNSGGKSNRPAPLAWGNFSDQCGTPTGDFSSFPADTPCRKELTEMRRVLVVLAVVLGVALGLAMVLRLVFPMSGTETDYPSALMWNDTIYYLSVQEVEKVPDSAVVGTVTSETDTFPRKNAQANCCPPGTPIAETEEGLAVLLEGVWRLCRAEEAASPSKAG